MDHTLAAIAAEAEDFATTARRLAEGARHLPRVAHHAQVAVGWTGVIRDRASSAGKDESGQLADYSEYQERLRNALARALAEIIAARLGERLNERCKRSTPPPFEIILDSFSEDVLSGISYDTWCAAWGFVRSPR